MNETINDILKEMRDADGVDSSGWFTRKHVLDWADCIEAATSALRDENAKLKAALKPVLECEYRTYHDGMVVWDGNPRWAVLKAHQIYKEGTSV